MQPRPPHDSSGQPTPEYIGRRRPAEDRLEPDEDFRYARAPQPQPVPPVEHRDDYAVDHGADHGGDDHDYDHTDRDHDGYDDDDQDDHDYRDRSAAGQQRRTLIGLVSALIVVAVAIGGFVLVRNVISGFGGDDGPSDYTGAGGEAVTVTVPAGASTTDIANLLAEADVVASASLFLDAAAANPSATSIQPGTYELRRQLPSVAALALLLDPANRSVTKLVIPEGYRIDQVVAAVAEILELDAAEVAALAADPAQVGVPAGFEGATSLEGMFFPATYDLGPGTTALQALQAMTAKFSAVMAETGFVAKAKALGITPYEALKVASMAEAEATNFTDWSKVARVIYNRTDNGEPLGIDSTSVYEARLAGKDPMAIDYDVPTPYNTRRTPGFPPTPIGNPGQETLRAAVEPAAGNWLYYVQTDAKGTLSFTADINQFYAWAQECIDNSWGNC